jgi:diketogulonate reductase-like aldo/keto reductase
MKNMLVPDVKLNSGDKMPGLGFGLWQIKNREECISSVGLAVKAGYRHFDTAQVYGNEQFLAEGLMAAKLPRQETFITTKISIRNFLSVKKSFDESLRKLETNYVDLLLLHYPVSALRGSAWNNLEQIHEAGQARSIGVSNYTIRHLKQLLEKCTVKPAVNQVELHVYLQQPELLTYCEEQGIIVEAYSPLAHGQGIDNPVLIEIGKKFGKTPAQIMLRWCVEAGTVPLPKSVTPERLKQNIDIFDFKLDLEDLQNLQTLEQGLRTCWDPTRTP